MRAPIEDDAHLRSALRSRGLKATYARIAILRLLRSLTMPVGSAEIIQSLPAPAPDRRTVFASLADLVRAGLIHRAATARAAPTFRIAAPVASRRE